MGGVLCCSDPYVPPVSALLSVALAASVRERGIRLRSASVQTLLGMSDGPLKKRRQCRL